MILYCSANSSTANEEILLWMLSSFELLWSFLFTLRWDANFSVYLAKTLFVMRIKCRNTKTAPVDTQRLQREKNIALPDALFSSTGRQSNDGGSVQATLLVCYCLHLKWYIHMLGLSIRYDGWPIHKNNKEVKGYTGEKFKITITNIYRRNVNILIYIFIYRRAIRRTNLSTYVP